jgi:hypothetical protein
MYKLNPLREARKPLTMLRACSCLLMNQFVTPGFGSLMAGRILEGILQLTIALIGFGLFIGWFLEVMFVLYSQIGDSPVNSLPYPWLGKVALIIFAIAWLFAWVTSISVVLEARRRETNKPPFLPLPPRNG